MTWPEVSWQVALWRGRRARRGLAALALAPFVTFLLPLHRVVSAWGVGARAVTVIGALILGVVVGQGTALPRPSFIWLYQKGISIPDHVLRQWLVGFGGSAIIAVLWSLGWVVGAGLYDAVSLAGAGEVLVIGTAVLLVMQALLFPIAAFGGRRGSDIAGVLVLVSLLRPLVAGAGLSKAAVVSLWVVLPPFWDAVTIGASLRAGAWGTVAGALAHILSFAVVMLGLGVWRLGRWRGERR